MKTILETPISEKPTNEEPFPQHLDLLCQVLALFLKSFLNFMLASGFAVDVVSDKFPRLMRQATPMATRVLGEKKPCPKAKSGATKKGKAISKAKAKSSPKAKPTKSPPKAKCGAKAQAKKPQTVSSKAKKDVKMDYANVYARTYHALRNKGLPKAKAR